MLDISAYKFTILASIVVLILSVGVLTALSGPNNAAQYITFLAPTLVALLAVLRSEQNAKQSTEQHNENRAALTRLVTDNNTLADAMQQIRSSDKTVEEAALAAASLIKSMPATPPDKEERV